MFIEHENAASKVELKVNENRTKYMCHDGKEAWISRRYWILGQPNH